MKELNQVLGLSSEKHYMLDKQLKLLLKRDSISVIKLSKATGVNAKTIYNYLDGRSPRNLDHIRILCEHFQVTSDFLLFGIEPANALSSKNKPGTSLDELVQFGRFDVFLKRVAKN